MPTGTSLTSRWEEWKMKALCFFLALAGALLSAGGWVCGRCGEFNSDDRFICGKCGGPR